MENKSKKVLVIVVILTVFCVISGLVSVAVSRNFLWDQALDSNSQYYLTVNEILANDSHHNIQIRVSGAVIGDSIQYVEENNQLSFLIANVPGTLTVVEKQGGILKVLENAVIDQNASRVQIIYFGEFPTLLRDKAQAILVGELNFDGIFYADEILLKCPSRYEEDLPDQAK